MTLTVAWFHILRIPRLFISWRILGHDIGGNLAILYCQHLIPCVNSFLGSKCLQHIRHLVKAKYGEIVGGLPLSLVMYRHYICCVYSHQESISFFKLFNRLSS